MRWHDKTAALEESEAILFTSTRECRGRGDTGLGAYTQVFSTFAQLRRILATNYTVGCTCMQCKGVKVPTGEHCKLFSSVNVELTRFESIGKLTHLGATSLQQLLSQSSTYT